MSNDTVSYALEISDHLFRLTTESVRLRSNMTMRYETLSALVETRAEVARSVSTFTTGTLRKHFATVPTAGSVRVEFRVSGTGASRLSELQKRIGLQLGSVATIGDAMSFLLFDFVVEQKAAGVLLRLGLVDAANASDDPDGGGSRPDNVVPIR